MDTLRAAQAARATSIPTDDGRSSFTVEILNGDRIALRVGRLSIFFTRNEGHRILAAMSGLLGVETRPGGRL